MTATGHAELRLYTGFDYAPNLQIEGASSSNDLGFDGPWSNAAADVDLDTSSSLPYPEGVDVVGQPGRLVDLAGGTADRPVSGSALIDLDTDQDYYFSLLFQQNSARFARVNFYAGETEVMQVGGGTDRKFRLFFNNETVLHFGDQTEDQQTYLLAGKIEASAAGPDPAFLKVYQAGVDTVGAEPFVWDLSSTTTPLTGIIDSVRLQAGTGGTTADWMVDELRIGTSWKDVAREAVAGDITGEGQVDLADFQIISDHFRQSVPALTDGDLDGDGFVGSRDFRFWKQASMAQSASNATSQLAVPEPGSTALLLVVAVPLLVSSSSRIVRRSAQASRA